VQKIILPQNGTNRDLFKYIPSKKKIQATLIYFLEASQAMKKDDF